MGQLTLNPKSSRLKLLPAQIFAAMLTQVTTVAAADYCATDEHPEPPRYPDLSLTDEVVMSADTVDSDPADPQKFRLNGMISIRHRDGGIKAENATYDPVTDIARVDGVMSYEAAGLTVESADANVNIKDGTFRLGDSGYKVQNGSVISQGRAGSISRDAKGNLRLSRASYSSCPPGDNGWGLKAKNIKLDLDAGVGTARGVSLRFKDVPILYAPAFSFPISNRRKSGLLAPRFDQNDQTGLEYRQPFYWNIKPNLDATFVLRSMSDRGFQLQTETRYLNKIGSWTLNHEAMSSDDRFVPGESRRFSRFRHKGELGERWLTAIDVSSVSDKDYFEDLGDTLNIASITHLQRRADLTYQADNYQFRTRLLSYQTVDSLIEPDERPYQQLPQVTLQYQSPVKRLGIDTSIDAEVVYFERDNSVTGSRVDLTPRAEWTVNRPGWFTSLATSWRLTRYDLNNVDPADIAQFRALPQFSADAGLFFERLNPENNNLLTFEPRMFYLYTPRRNQSRIPIFDTGALDFNFSQLFRENRFSGADRVNDANQLSVAVSSRMLDPGGREKFSASVGQILYFDDRRVTLPDGVTDTNTSSDIIAEVQNEINQRWSGGVNLQWDPNNGDTQRSSAQLKYRNGTGKLINFGHRYLKEDGEFIHASFAWPLNAQWRLANSWNYSLDDSQDIETVLGLEYDSCCWAFRTAARRFITDDGDDTTTSFFFQLVLKGLTPVGQNVTDVLREAIGGYSSDND
ncbi:hypothetical protein AB833_03360 [Chromatiales bacterium (ex Bugula neritina AB1)]|nr:hypothetical protein AB833_03360 [Chromatiales bacterium (ex Bugula neritina AB1)]